MTTPTAKFANAGARIRHVFVRDLTLLALIGIDAAEKLKPQRIIVNIDLSVRESAGPMPDDISHVVSYAIVAKKCEAMSANDQVYMVEKRAENVTEASVKDKGALEEILRLAYPAKTP